MDNTIAKHQFLLKRLDRYTEFFLWIFAVTSFITAHFSNTIVETFFTAAIGLLVYYLYKLIAIDPIPRQWVLALIFAWYANFFLYQFQGAYEVLACYVFVIAVFQVYPENHLKWAPVFFMGLLFILFRQEALIPKAFHFQLMESKPQVAPLLPLVLPVMGGLAIIWGWSWYFRTTTEEAVAQYFQMINQKEEVDVQRDRLLESSKQLEKQNHQLNHSIFYAERIQKALFSSQEVFYQHFEEAFILYQPRDVVSGDFYWFTEVDEKIIVAAFDCTGHGVPGAFLSCLGHQILQQLVEIQGLTDPQHILFELHRWVVKSLHQDMNENKDGMDASICTIDKRKGLLKFAGAKNPLLMVQNGELTRVKGSRVSVGGIMSKEVPRFEQKVWKIDQETTCYIFSDGYKDQLGGPRANKFMSKNLQQLIRRIQAYDMQTQKDILWKELEQWRGDHPQVDDILMIGFRIDPAMFANRSQEGHKSLETIAVG